MAVRVALAAILLFSVACTKEPAPAKADAAVTTPPSRVSSLPPPAKGPCATDADCNLYLEPCSCGCIAHVGPAPDVPNAQWSTVCGGGPPGNCGVASPCMNRKATCDVATKTCALAR